MNPDVGSPLVLLFYYHGHARPEGFGYGRPADNEGVLARDLQRTLMNLYFPKFSDTQCRYEFYKPFTFVFIDGCLSGKGELPEAFGIPKAVSSASYEANHRKKRAFLGWNSKTKDSIANNDFMNWTFKFWQEWLNDPDYNNPVQEAINSANATYPGVANQNILALHGSQTLRWRD